LNHHTSQLAAFGVQMAVALAGSTHSDREMHVFSLCCAQRWCILSDWQLPVPVLLLLLLLVLRLTLVVLLRSSTALLSICSGCNILLLWHCSCGTLQAAVLCYARSQQRIDCHYFTFQRQRQCWSIAVVS
jgi:hypothetical protein